MNKDREKAILEIAIKEKRVTVKNLAQRLYASEPSIRRDLSSLETQRLLKRTHGGAVLDENALSEIKIPFLIRELEKSDEKVKIARKAAELVADNSVLFLDASTSAYNLVPFLAQKQNLLVITNGLKTLQRLAEQNIACVGTGGRVLNSGMAFVGEESYRTVAQFNADYFFFSCRGLANGLLSDISQQENLVRQEMLRHAKAGYLLCTSSRLGKVFYHNLCTEKDITGVIDAT